MSLVKKGLIVLLTTWLAIIFFAPKREICYYLQNRLTQAGFTVSLEKISEKPLGIEIGKATIIFPDKNQFSFENVTLWTLLFYTHFRIKELKLSYGASRLPLILGEVKGYYALWDPFEILFKGTGAAAQIEGVLNLKERVLSFHLKGEKRYLSTPGPHLKKDKEGWFFEDRY
ncbi:hypothetical protein [Nitratifractor sp.]|uniref:hypothetical protein n=1 Tax=Nitratifractor sp. TaxID=2268144 RepID=UPI0025CF5091|nr:hypothetical protein [Nitratifractor sp.]